MPIVRRKMASQSSPAPTAEIVDGGAAANTPSNAAQPNASRPAQPDAPKQPKAARSNKRTGPNWNEDGTPKVGKGKPPPEHQWKKGQSGNPKGSKKKEKPDADAIVINLMEESRWLTSPEGVKREVTAQAAMYRKLYELGIKGNLKAAQYLLDRLSQALERRASKDVTQAGLSAAEEEILRAMFNGLRPDGEGAPA